MFKQTVPTFLSAGLMAGGGGGDTDLGLFSTLGGGGSWGIIEGRCWIGCTAGLSPPAAANGMGAGFDGLRVEATLGGAGLLPRFCPTLK